MRQTFYCQTENCREGCITGHYATMSAADQVVQQSKTLSVQLNPILAAQNREWTILKPAYYQTISSTNHMDYPTKCTYNYYRNSHFM